MRTLGVVWSARVVRGVSVCLSVVTGQASVKDPSGQPAPAGLRDSKIQIEVRLANSEVKCKVNMSSSFQNHIIPDKSPNSCDLDSVSMMMVVLVLMMMKTCDGPRLLHPSSAH